MWLWYISFPHIGRNHPRHDRFKSPTTLTPHFIKRPWPLIVTVASLATSGANGIWPLKVFDCVSVTKHECHRREHGWSSHLWAHILLFETVSVVLEPHLRCLKYQYSCMLTKFTFLRPDAGSRFAMTVNYPTLAQIYIKLFIYSMKRENVRVQPSPSVWSPLSLIVIQKCCELAWSIHFAWRQLRCLFGWADVCQMLPIYRIPAAIHETHCQIKSCAMRLCIGIQVVPSLFSKWPGCFTYIKIPREQSVQYQTITLALICGST